MRGLGGRCMINRMLKHPPKGALCDKCRQPFEYDDYFLLFNPILGQYLICDRCSLALEKFIDSVDKRIERRARVMGKDLRALGKIN